jgi:hypothetical protein
MGSYFSGSFQDFLFIFGWFCWSVFEKGFQYATQAGLEFLGQVVL